MLVRVIRQFRKSIFSSHSKACSECSKLCRDFSNLPPVENPISRTVKIISEDVKNIFSKQTKWKKDVFPSHCDVLVIGGGVMGCSIAFWLKYRALEGLNVVVVEKDPTVKFSDNSFERLKYQECTSALAVGGIRQQFSLKENIELSLKSADFLRNIKHYLSIDGYDPPDIQFNPAGYLFLAGERGASILEENYHLQRSLGAKVEFLSPEELKKRFPWLCTDGIAAATHGLENEGWFDPYSLLHAFKRKAAYLGTHFVTGEVVQFEAELTGIEAIRDGKPVKRQTHTAVVELPDGTKKTIHYGILVIAAGGRSGHVSELLGAAQGDGMPRLPLPVEPRKRYVFNVHCPKGPGVAAPMVIDSSGAYVRRDGLVGNYLCGISPTDDEEPVHDNLDVDYSFFENKVWPIIANRIPSFEEAKLKSAWAGYYDFNRFDENAFIGPHPGYMNVYLATGFSGHGLQQSPAVGKAIMELIIDGEYQSINLERLHFNRYIDGEPLYESNIV